ncbi:LytR cell envelope-related transcriptional attenuator [Nocardioides terrae]|uniref:LytR cell envelope-related transcriptional attenuator n=1 Tax=Nocardioides terrae TaxID=574651 RepID=A0A1I1H173_9ACTN|nr:LytR C-terminal domain-containing protein [Nocardioides terrae]SFC14930.1 LytR cell envelope-related transcriptional attenuator [Nocardioides terrae]
MTQAVKTTVTLAVLAALLGFGASWGWSALTAPLPELADAPTCVETPIEAGDTITPERVTVSVLNAGKRVGLATRTMTALTGQGFNKGDRGNAPSGTDVGNAQIWTDDPGSPAVALVASRIPKVRVVQRDVDQVGVVLVVGDKFDTVSGGVASVEAAKGTTICSPPT